MTTDGAMTAPFTNLPYAAKISNPEEMPGSTSQPASVAGAAASISLTPTISTTAYAAKDVVGGKLTLANAVRVSGGIAILQSVFVLDRANQKAAISILLFDADPTASTLTNDAEANIVSADIPKLIRRIDIAASDYVTTDHAGTDFATAEIAALSKLVKAASGTSLYAVVITSGTPSYGVNDALTVRFGFLYAN